MDIFAGYLSSFSLLVDPSGKSEVPICPCRPETSALRRHCNLIDILNGTMHGVGPQFEHARVGVGPDDLKVEFVCVLLSRHFERD